MNNSNWNQTEVERLLTHLGTAEVSPGFEDRIRRGVQARQEHRRRPPMRWFMGVAATLTAAALCTTLWLHTNRRATEPLHADLRSPAPVPASHRPEPAPAHVVHVSHTTKTLRKSGPVLETGFPAPPAPLTEQERLLIRLAHRGDPEEIAMLDPKIRELDEAKGRAEFDRFFAPPLLPKSETTPTEKTGNKSSGDAR